MVRVIMNDYQIVNDYEVEVVKVGENFSSRGYRRWIFL